MALRLLQTCLVLLALGLAVDVRAEDTVPAVYQRSREGEFVNHGGGWQGGQRGWGNWGGGLYNPWFGPQFFAGTWYQRPYPDHMIYNNVRSGIPSVPGSIVAGSVAPNCPCAEMPIQ